jgi:hypothetical protein
MMAQYDQAVRDHMIKRRNVRQRFERIFKDDAADDDIDDDNGNGNGNGNGNEPRHLVDQLADLLVEGGSADGEITREQALQYLLHSERGQALVARMAAHRKQQTDKGTSPMHSTDSVHRIAKAFVKSGRSFMSEHDLVKKIEEYAKATHAHLSGAQAFAKVFTAATPEGDLFRKAVQVAKQPDHDDDDGDAEDAMERLRDLAEQHHRANPELTEAQSFARVFVDPRNAALAHRAHKRPTANEKNAFPFPR